MNKSVWCYDFDVTFDKLYGDMFRLC